MKKKILEKKEKTTIDDLAVMVQNGFADMSEKMVTKIEFNEFKADMFGFRNKTDMTLFNLDNHAQETNKRLDAIEKALGPLVQVSSFMQNEIRSLNGRVSSLERKVGINK